MEFFDRIIFYAEKYDFFVFAAVAAALFATVGVNALFNVYRRDNAKMKRSGKLLQTCVKRDNFAPFDKTLSAPFRYRLHLYCRYRLPAEEVFVFLKQRTYCVGVPLLVLSAVAFAPYPYLFAKDPSRQTYLFACVTYLCLFVLTLYAVRVIHRAQQKGSEKVFRRYVALLTAYFCRQPETEMVSDEENDDTVRQIRLLRGGGDDKETAMRVAELLKQKGAKQRTAGQQRQINRALSDLLQNMA